jgi:hypothetical protein
MADLQVTCVKTLHSASSDKDSYWLAGPGWSKPQSEVVLDIQLGRNTCYTLVLGRRAVLQVVGNE